MEFMKPCWPGTDNDDTKGFYYSVFETQAIGHIIIDADTNIVAANKCMFRNFNIAPYLAENRTFGSLFNCMALESGMCCGQAPACKHCKLNYCLHGVFKHKIKSVPIRYRFMVDGKIKEKYFMLNSHSLTYQGERYASLSFVDETYSKRREKNLKKQLEYDFATGAKNRRALFNTVHKLLMGSLYFSIVMLDFDYFKLINDTCGHVKGDKVLSQFSKIVYRNIRRGDLFARYGGEEFILLFKRTTTDEAIEIVERIQNELKGFFDGRIQHPVTFSAGLLYVDLRKEKIKDTTDLFSRVDKLLYEAKNSGRNKIVTGHGERCFK